MPNSRIRGGSPSVVAGEGARRPAPTALLALAVVTAALALAVVPGPAAAQEVHGVAAALDCGDFATQRGAQAIFERSPASLGGDDPFELDEDNDGKACEAATPAGASEDGTELGAEAGGDLDCVDLPSQAAAQERLRNAPADPDGLDPDNNGIACEIAPAPYENPALDVAPVPGARSDADLDCEDFEYQYEAQSVYDMDRSDPNGLDGPNEPAEKYEQFVGNGLPCEAMPDLASNGALMVTDAGAEDADTSAASTPLGLAAVWTRDVGLGLLLDLTALLMVTCGIGALVVLRSRRSSSGGSDQE